MHQFHFQLTLIKERGERARSQQKSNKTMDKSSRPTSSHQSCSRSEQQDPSPIPPQHSASVPTSGVVGNAVISHHTMGGKSVNLPPSGTAQTQRSATMDVACAPPHTSEVTPILVLLQKSTPQRIGNRTSAAFRASINAAALANLGGNNNDNGNDYNDGYSYFRELLNPDPKDLLLQDICSNFILLFVDSRKCQKTYSKSRKIKIFYNASTVEKKGILGNSPPPRSEAEVPPLIPSCEAAG
jgi:hypothetical protein